jgi:hypothetical protein
MFAFLSTVKVKRFLFAGLVLLTFAFLGGCNVNGEDDTNYEGALPESIKKTWSSSGDGYIIGTNNFQYTSDYDGAFTGVISFVSNYSANSGVIIIKYTNPPTHLIWETDQPFYDGKDFTAIYYQNLTGNTVQLATVVNLVDYSSVNTASLEEAKAKFTRSQIGNYVGAWGTYSSR